MLKGEPWFSYPLGGEVTRQDSERGRVQRFDKELVIINRNREIVSEI